MITVANTRQLESRYDLSKISDDEQILVEGGMAGKQKYNSQKYEYRRTYTGREIKQIIGQMKIIESAIPKEWNQMQRAKYIYEVLGKNIEYNHNPSEYSTQRPSSLATILDRKAICAGYSLLYKEMMDRQGIQCDYMRGIGTTSTGRSEKHAWNVLTIDGVSFPVDLTWDSPVLRRGENQLQYFGNDPRFFDRHITDQDEFRYNYQTLSSDYVNSINTNPNVRQAGLEQEDKMSIVKLAIEQTYTKFEKNYGRDAARNQIIKAIDRYIKTGNADSFTRQGFAREQILKHVSSEDMLNLVAQSFVEQNYGGTNQDLKGRVLENSVNQTALAYGTDHTSRALVDYIKTGKTLGFTRTNNARLNLTTYAILPDNAMSLMVDTVASRSIEEIEQDKTITVQDTYFYADELASNDLPVEKKKNVISKAIQWIKEKTKEKFASKGKQSQEVQASRETDDER